jgi:hypothetical protein
VQAHPSAWPSTIQQSVQHSRMRTMSTFKLKDYDDVTVSLPDGLSEDQLTTHHPFKVINIHPTPVNTSETS